ncbi:MAG: thymidine phosphorylase [Candidatus Pacearchaeota archaeon]
MNLKVKFLNFSAGRPIIILNKTFAKNNAIHVDSRINIIYKNKEIIAVVDLASNFIKENEAIISSEVVNYLNIHEGEEIKITLAKKPISTKYILKKLNNKKLNKEEIRSIIKDISINALTESEIAFFVSAVYKCGMSFKELIYMIEAIVETGKKLNLGNKIVVDKHSIGGIPGRVTPIIVSICAAAGLTIPKTSSRAITTPSGTADALETICKVDFSLKEIKEIIKKTNACFVWGGSLDLAPADDKIIQIEKIINLDPEAQLLASIISKKIAVGAKYVVIDIPYGKFAKVSFSKAIKLEKKFLEIAKYFKIILKCSLKEINEPLGNGIGPALEIQDVIKVLSLKDSCNKLEERALELSSIILEMTGKAKIGKGKELAKKILYSGKAFEKFNEIIKAQKGDINFKFKEAQYKKDILAEKKGIIKEINIKLINYLAILAGCPMDKYAGIYLHKHLNQEVKKGEKILTIYSENEEQLNNVIKIYNENNPIIIK